ncbi:hypothetical protein VTK26DRAFT_151 [Humicola hyalothermophila]
MIWWVEYNGNDVVAGSHKQHPHSAPSTEQTSWTDSVTTSDAMTVDIEASPVNTEVTTIMAVAPFGKMKTPTTQLTASQSVYIFVIDGIFAMLISAVINFAIGYGASLSPFFPPFHLSQSVITKLTDISLPSTGVYATPRPPYGPPPLTPPPFLFALPQSFVADAAITTILQCLLTWLLMLVAVNVDLKRGRVAPLLLPGSRFLAAEPTSRLARWFLFLDSYPTVSSIVQYQPQPRAPAQAQARVAGVGVAAADTDTDTEKANKPAQDDASKPAGPTGDKKTRACCGLLPLSASTTTSRAGRWAAKPLFFLANLGRGMLVAAAAYAVLIGPTVGLLIAASGVPYPGGGDWVFLWRWDGPVFKALYGAALAGLTSPAIAAMWMVRAGWMVLRKEKTEGF